MFSDLAKERFKRFRAIKRAWGALLVLTAAPAEALPLPVLASAFVAALRAELAAIVDAVLVVAVAAAILAFGKSTCSFDMSAELESDLSAIAVV